MDQIDKKCIVAGCNEEANYGIDFFNVKAFCAQCYDFLTKGTLNNSQLRKNAFLQTDISQVRVICSALWYDIVEEKLRAHQPKNIENGIVCAGLRHCNCLTTLWATTDKVDKTKVHYGFITSDHFFVDRKEAAKIAFNAGQIKFKRDQLFSEDLY